MPVETGLSQKLSPRKILKISAPTVNDDISLGYQLGDFWINTAGPTVYQLIDNTAGAAVWSTETVLTKTGNDSAVVSGTEGIDGNLVKWNADGDAVDASIDATAVITKSSNHHSKGFFLENPGSSEDEFAYFIDDAITITKMVAVLGGSSTPSVTWTIRHDPDRTATGNEVVTGGTTTTSTTTGSIVTSFNDATVPADSYIWVETTAQSGTVNQITITIYYTYD